MENNNLKNKQKRSMCNVAYIGYLVKFNEPDLNGTIIKKEAIQLDSFQQIKIRGDIIDYKIDENGLKVIKKINLTSVDKKILK
jgi:hypothetical protein